MPRDPFRPAGRWGRRTGLAGIALLALAAGWGAGRYLDEAPGAPGREPASPPAADRPAGPDAAPADLGAVLHRHRPDFALPDLEGRRRTPREWDGKVLVINFWATWCAPCREEIPMLIELEQRRPDVRVVGVALDAADAVRAFAKELAIGYPLLLDDARGSTMRRYGNRLGALPFTVVAGRDGVVGYVRLGVLDPAELETAVAALL